MTDDSVNLRVLLVGSTAFCESADAAIRAASRDAITITTRETLSDLDQWDQDLVLFRLSSKEPEFLETMLEFLSAESRAEAVVVVGSGEEDLGIGAVARGAMDFIVDEDAEYGHIERFASQGRRRNRKPNLDSFATFDAFTTYCQPIVDIVAMTAIGWEFLSRGPAGPLNQPTRFFRWGIKNDRLVEFDLLCLDAGIEAARQSSCQGRLHFNLFPQSLRTDAIWERLDALRELTCEPVCLEVSETTLTDERIDIIQERKTLADMRIELAIDDIGFQARGFGLVRQLRPDVLKLDRRITEGLLRHQSKRDILASSLTLGESLGAIVIVEGVELESELHILREFGVRYAQGFYWGKPTLPDQAVRSLRFGGSRQEQS